MPGLEYSINTIAFDLMSDGVASEQVKKFFFTSGKARPQCSTSKDRENDDEEDESLEVSIPEVSHLLFVYFLGFLKDFFFFFIADCDIKEK